MLVIPVLGGGVGFVAGTPASNRFYRLSNSVGISLGGDAGTNEVGSNGLSKVSSCSVIAGGTVTVTTIRSSNPHPGSSTVYIDRALPGCGLLNLRASVSAWLSHTRQLSTISRIGVSGGTLSKCRCKAQLSWPATNRSRIMRSHAVWPMSPVSLVSIVLQRKLTDYLLPSGSSSQTDIDSPPTDPATHNVPSVPQPVRSAWLTSPLAPVGPRATHRLPGET